MTQSTKALSHIYGPVPSRRLGFSLGVDIIPYKTCSLDCVYCQLGPTPEKTVTRKTYYSAEKIIPQIRSAIQSGRRIDTITFSGSGEPTLNILIGDLIRQIKGFTKIPVTVLTNSTLMPKLEVRQALLSADRIVPSLDAATQEVFERINRPASGLKIADIIEGLSAFRKKFSGLIWLEILFVKGINDSPDHLTALKTALDRIQPDRIQLNTVIRPPSDRGSKPLSPGEMESIRAFFGEKAEIIADMTQAFQNPVEDNPQEQILAVIRRRPVTRNDLAKSLGFEAGEVKECLETLMKQKLIQEVIQDGKTFYKPI